MAGTSAQLYVWNNETYADLEQSEPLGERISSISPPEEGYQSYTAHKGNVGEPEWQCEAPREMFGNFSSLPWHCQRAAIERAGKETPYEHEKDENPKDIDHAADSASDIDYAEDAANPLARGLHRLMIRTLDSTKKRHRDGKQPDDDGGSEPVCPEGTTWIKDAKGEIQCIGAGVSTVNVDPPDGDFLEFFAGIAPLIKLVLERVELVGFNESQSEMILKHVATTVFSRPCVNAFKAAGIPTPAEVIRDRGLLFINADALQGPRNTTLKRLNFTEDERAVLSRVADERKLRGAGGFTIDPNSPSGQNKPATTILFNSSFTDQTDFSFREVMPHEAIHRSNVGRHYSFWQTFFPFYGHDLTGYEHYENILKNCSV